MSNRAVAPLTFVPQAFHANLREGFLDYDHSRRDYHSYLEQLHIECELAEGQPPVDSQRTLSILHDNLVSCARECALFLAYCLKNHAFMAKETALMQEAVATQTNRRIQAISYARQSHVQGQMDTLNETLFHALDRLHALMTPETQEYRKRTPFRGDPYTAEYKQGERLRRADFHDWVEFNFFRLYHLPLGIYPRTSPLDAYMRRQIASSAFCWRVITSITGKQMQGMFPGLTLDALPDKGTKLDRIRREMDQHAFFTPSTTAHIISTAVATGGSRAYPYRP